MMLKDPGLLEQPLIQVVNTITLKPLLDVFSHEPVLDELLHESWLDLGVSGSLLTSVLRSLRHGVFNDAVGSPNLIDLTQLILLFVTLAPLFCIIE